MDRSDRVMDRSASGPYLTAGKSTVQQGKNIRVSGGTGTGKTTLLNATAAGIARTYHEP